jgi:hypothetical protein
MAAKTISQKKWAKLVASTGVLAQPPGAISRLSNLLFTQRGSLQVCDGSALIGQLATPYVRALALGSYNSYTAGQFPFYLALASDPYPAIDEFLPGSYSVAVSGGSGPNTQYFFFLAAFDSSGLLHNTPVAISTNARSSATTVTANFTVPAGAATVKLYWQPTGFNVPAVLIGSSATSPISATFFGTETTIPTGNDSYTSQLEIGTVSPASNQENFTIVSSTPYPGPVIAAVSLAPGDSRFNYAAPYPGYSPYGGAAGVIEPIPEIIQFAGKAILILGNGVAPQSIDPAATIPTPTNLINTFQDSYPTWQASVSWTTDDQLTAADGTTNYYFTATQGGVSGTTAPSWNFTKGAQTTDGTVIWTSQGPIVSSIAPIGAAHAVAYAGSLWLANTWPTTTEYASWAASTDYVVGTQIAVQDTATPSNSWIFTVQTAGTSSSTTPSWDFTVGNTTTDGGVTWYATSEPAAALVAGIDGPSCLKMSDSNNPNSWNPVNAAFIGKNDGTQITGLCPFTIAALGISPTGSLCIFKEYSTYQFIGVFGSTSYEIQPAQTNLGCIAARSIQFLPGFGVVRYTHLGFAVFDGIKDRLISEDIRPYLFGGVDSEADLTPVDPSYLYLSQSAQTVTPPMYLCVMPLAGGGGALTRLFCYDLIMKAWTVLDLPWPITTLSAIAAGEGYPLVLAGKADGSIQRLQAGDMNWNQGETAQSAVQWSFRTPDLFGEGGTQRMFYEQATITGYGSADMVQSIVANLWLDGAQLGPCAIDVVPQGDSTFVARVNIFRSGQRAHLDVSGNGGGGGGTIDSVDWAVVPKSAMARRIIS